MRSTTSFLVSILFLILSLSLPAACGNAAGSGTGSAGGDVVGDAARGEALYKQTAIGAGSAPGCITCHSLEPGRVLVGPSHAGLGARAGTAVAGKSAEEFLRESIVDPNAELVEGISGVMYQNYKTDLSEQQIADLVAFLLSLK